MGQYMMLMLNFQVLFSLNKENVLSERYNYLQVEMLTKQG